MTLPPTRDQKMTSTATVVTEARNGDLTALRQLQKSLPHDPSRASPHSFHVRDGSLVEDSLWPSTVKRKDIYPPIPKFVTEGMKASWGVSPRYVINVVKRYPSLVDQFAIQGYQKIKQFEDSLISADGLKRSNRVRVTDQIARLSNDRAPVWQNWVGETAAKGGTTFDGIVTRWLNEPTNWSECRYFDDVKMKRHFGCEAARTFFEQMPADHLEYLGLKLNDGIVEGTEEVLKCVFLNEPIKDANRRARALGVKFRFEVFE